MMKKNQLSKLLRALAAAVEDLDERELDQLISGKGKLVFSDFNEKRQYKDFDISDFEKAIEKLNGTHSREEASKILNSITNRDQLASLARMLRIHIIKNDRREDIENKIVEFVIGGKLRSKAIQTINFKSSS